MGSDSEDGTNAPAAHLGSDGPGKKCRKTQRGVRGRQPQQQASAEVISLVSEDEQVETVDEVNTLDAQVETVEEVEIVDAQTDAVAGSPEAAEVQIHHLDVDDECAVVPLNDRPATAPAAVERRTAHTQEGDAIVMKMVGLEWSTQDQIVQAVELKRLIRTPRYFDEDAGQLISTMRCFNCGKMGHRALDCTNAARQKPCYLCAQLGHDGRECPNRLCFKCGRPGHLSRDCATGRVEGWESALGVCNRCGSDACACAGKGDYFRYEGGCSGTYTAEDLKSCRCYVCGKLGHLCCKPPPRVPAAGNSCYCCGAEGHVGEDCPRESRPHLAAERMGDMRKATALRDAEQAAAAYSAAQRAQGGGRFNHAPPRQHQRFEDDMDITADGAQQRRNNVMRPDFNALGRSISAPRLGGPQYAPPVPQYQPPQYGMQQYGVQQYGVQQYGAQRYGQPQMPQYQQYTVQQYNAPAPVQPAYGHYQQQAQQPQQYQQQRGGYDAYRDASAPRDTSERDRYRGGGGGGRQEDNRQDSGRRQENKRGRYDDEDRGSRDRSQRRY